MLCISGYLNDAKEGVDTNCMDKFVQLRKARAVYDRIMEEKGDTKGYNSSSFATWCLVAPGMVPSITTIGAMRRIVRAASKFSNESLSYCTSLLGKTEVKPGHTTIAPTHHVLCPCGLLFCLVVIVVGI